MTRIPIDRDGLPSCAAGLAAAGLGLVLGGRWGSRLAALGGGVAAGCAFFFRDPEREVLPVERGILSPADGKIIDLREVDGNEFFPGPSWKVSIFLNLFNCHIVRIPVSGEIAYKGEAMGGYAPAYDPAAETNRRLSVGIKGSDGSPDCLMRLVAGLVARQIVCRKEIGDHVEQGERLGLIKFGSRVDLFFPRALDLTIAPGECVSGGITMLARPGRGR